MVEMTFRYGSADLRPDGPFSLFMGDLHLASEDPLRPDRLAATYASALEPQMVIAKGSVSMPSGGSLTRGKGNERVWQGLCQTIYSGCLWPW
jgi:hypothetical protein